MLKVPRNSVETQGGTNIWVEIIYNYIHASLLSNFVKALVKCGSLPQGGDVTLMSLCYYGVINRQRLVVALREEGQRKVSSI